jgi:hypothetical protein
MIYLLVLANALVFMLSTYGHVSTTALYLNHQKAAWYQLVTSTFCHANIQVCLLLHVNHSNESQQFAKVVDFNGSCWIFVQAASQREPVSIAGFWSAG